MNEELLIRFLTHRCTSQELDILNDWIAADSANAKWLFDIEHIWSLKDELRFSEKKEIETAYNRFISYIKEKEAPVQKAKRTFALSWFRYVAAILLIAFLGSGLYLLMDKGTVEMNIIEVPNGQRASVTLSDGTTVWLNSQSKLTYPAKFIADKRSVKLEGEGYFEVTHNAKSPFCVESNLIHVQVLGTKFNIKSYPDEPSAVTLTEGKVEVSDNGNQYRVTLKPNEQVSYSTEAGMKLTKNINANMVKSWTKGEIAYTNKTLKEIANDLERQFNVHISITDRTLAAEIFTCHFKQATTVEEVLKLLKETRKLDYRINEQKIEIYQPLK
ncbi:FecR family protein [Bacteroides sp.]